MPKVKPALNEILAAIQKGERLGIDEALIFLAETKKLIDRAGSETFFDSARAQARKHHTFRPLSIERLDRARYSLDELLQRAVQTDAEMVHLRFPTEMPFSEILAVVERLSEHIAVAAFSPIDILARAQRENLKATRACQSLGVSGLSFASGRVDAKATDAEIDEAFSVMMQLAKSKVSVSAALPISFSEEMQALHLAKLREFQDRTQAISFVMLYLDSTFSDRALLRTVALMRLMLDNITTISLSDYDFKQEKKIDGDLLRQCIDIGLNQI